MKEEVSNVYQYVVDLRNRLEKTCELAAENVRNAQRKYKSQKVQNENLRSRGESLYPPANREKQIAYAMERPVHSKGKDRTNRLPNPNRKQDKNFLHKYAEEIHRKTRNQIRNHRCDLRL